MKLVLKIFKIFSVVLIVLTITLFTSSLLMQDKVADVILRSFSKKISTEYEFSSVVLSFLKKFPKASLELKNVLVHSSAGFDATCFPGINTDTLLTAGTVSIEFSITDIIKGIYNVDRIGIKDGFLNLLSDSAGNVNYSISVKSATKSENQFMLNLDGINLSDLKASYINKATSLNISGFVEAGKLKTRFSGSDIDFTANAILLINTFNLYNFSISKDIKADLDINLKTTETGTFINKGNISFDNNIFGVRGSVSSEKVIDLKITGDNVDISGIKNYLPESYTAKILEYNPSGILKVESNISGPVTRTKNPGIEISGTLTNGTVSYLNSAVTIRDMSFSLYFNNGPGHAPSTSLLAVNDFKGKLGSAQYTGSAVLYEFDTLKGDLNLKGKVIPAELKQFFDLDAISFAEGSADIDLKVNGLVPGKKNGFLKAFFDLDPIADLEFNTFGIGFEKGNFQVRDLNGSMLVSDTVIAKNLKFNYKEHYFELNGFFINLPGWLIGEPVILACSADLFCGHLYPGILFASSSAKNNGSKRAYSLPADIVMDLSLTTEFFSYKNFKAGKLNGLFSYKPGILNFKSLSLNSLDGVISGNGFILQNRDKSFITRGTFDLRDINVKDAFISFNNFGQDFIKSENIAGKLSGSLSLLMPMDSMMKPVIKSITAEGKYLLTDGNLLDFDPVKKLSSYIELSELENIHFEELENNFFIRNNSLYTPQMDIKSSAADLSVNGKHNFDNNYEYHIRILLSELLSKKMKKPKSANTEFGAIRDDGLGRTAMLLKIEGRGEEVKVGYDVKAAGNEIKSDIKAERQNLKTILNQEYGWFRKDTVPAKQNPAKGTPRFKITWEETDTLKKEEPPPATRKESVVKNIFKK